MNTNKSKKLYLCAMAGLGVLSTAFINTAFADLTLAPLSGWDITGNYGNVLSLNGIPTSGMIVGTTFFTDNGTNHPGFSPTEPASNADDFSLATTASADQMDYVTTRFLRDVTRIFILEKNGNDSGLVQGLDINGDPIGNSFAFTGGAAYWANTGFMSHQVPPGAGTPQLAYGAIITSDVPIYGIRFAAPGIDPVSIMAVIPEPGTVALLGLGGLILLRRNHS